MVGEQLTLVATVKGSEPLELSWIQDKDHVLRDGDNRKITFENNVATLMVPRADSTTAGKYMCRLSNESGSVVSVSQVTVLGWWDSSCCFSCACFLLLTPFLVCRSCSYCGQSGVLEYPDR